MIIKHRNTHGSKAEPKPLERDHQKIIIIAAELQKIASNSRKNGADHSDQQRNTGGSM